MAPLDPITVYPTSLLNKKHLSSMQVFLVHQYNKGTGIKVGIVSSGIQPHVAFKAMLKGGKDFTTGSTIPATGGQDPIGDGTALAGLVAGNGTPFKASLTGGPLDLAIQGVAPECWLYDLRVTDSSGTFTTQRVIDALDWAIANTLDILLLAVGWENVPSQGLIDAIKRASDNNILMIAPIGSYAVGILGFSDIQPIKQNGLYPSSDTNVIGVGAVNVIDSRVYDFQLYRALDASPAGYVPGLYETYYKYTFWTGPGQTYAIFKLYTKRSTNLETTAPGGYYGIGVTKGTNDLGNVDGSTFYTTAYIAGFLALALSNGLSPTQARTRLQQGVKDLGNPGWDDTYGYGLPIAPLVAPPRVFPKDLAMADIKTLLNVGSNGLADPAKVSLYAGMSEKEFREIFTKPSQSIDRLAPTDAVLITRILSALPQTTKIEPLPYLSRYVIPGDGATNVPLNNPIKFTVKSETNGIDIDSVRVVIGTETYKKGDPGFSFSGNKTSYDVEVRRPQPWSYEESVSVTIEAWDSAGNPGLIYERVPN